MFVEKLNKSGKGFLSLSLETVEKKRNRGGKKREFNLSAEGIVKYLDFTFLKKYFEKVMFLNLCISKIFP